MRSKIKRFGFSRNGSVIVLAVIILVILSTLGVGVFATAYGVRHRAIRIKTETTAMLAAEAGYEKAIYWMGQQKDILSALQKGLDGTSGTLNFADGSCNYQIGLYTFIKSRPIYKVVSVGHSGVFHSTVDVYVVQAIPGWAMGMCRVPSGPSSSYPVHFANGEVIDMPVHINKLPATIDSSDLRDIYIKGEPQFLERVAMGESKYRDNGSDKPGYNDSRDYDDLMDLFEDGIFFKQPDCRITDEEAMDSKLERFEDSTDEQFIFEPEGTAPLTGANPSYTTTLPATQLEFFVEGGVGKVRITNNCTVLGYRRTSDSKTWDYKIEPGTEATEFERYYIYAYHVKPSGGASTVVPLEDTYVTQSFGGIDSEPGGQIYVDGNVVIGGHNSSSPDQIIKGTMAVVATGNIWVADSILVDGSRDDGKPAMDNPNAMGLIAKGTIKVIDPGMSSYDPDYSEFKYDGSSYTVAGNNYYPGPVPGKYRPESGGYESNYDYAPVAHPESSGETYERYLSDTIVEAAVTVGGGGWGAENVGRKSSSDNKYYGGRKESGTQDDLILRGAITECMRGVVGLIGTDGYLKQYYLDKRLLEGILPGDIWLQGKYVPTPAGWHDYRL